MTIHAWVTHDDDGREVLVREGTGAVTAVAAIGDPDEPALVYRVEIECERPRGRARAIRYSVHGLLEAHSPVVVAALDAQRVGQPVMWTIRWTRHPWVPESLPIASLDLATDTRATVMALVPIDIEALTDAIVDTSADGS